MKSSSGDRILEGARATQRYRILRYARDAATATPEPAMVITDGNDPAVMDLLWSGHVVGDCIVPHADWLLWSQHIGREVDRQLVSEAIEALERKTTTKATASQPV